jgi:hypothetical protein
MTKAENSTLVVRFWNFVAFTSHFRRESGDADPKAERLFCIEAARTTVSTNCTGSPKKYE